SQDGDRLRSALRGFALQPDLEQPARARRQRLETAEAALANRAGVALDAAVVAQSGMALSKVENDVGNAQRARAIRVAVIFAQGVTEPTHHSVRVIAHRERVAKHAGNSRSPEHDLRSTALQAKQVRI